MLNSYFFLNNDNKNLNFEIQQNYNKRNKKYSNKLSLLNLNDKKLY